MFKKVNTAGGTCERCGTFVSTGNGWACFRPGVGWILYHNSCYNSEKEGHKTVLKRAFKEIDAMIVKDKDGKVKEVKKPLKAEPGSTTLGGPEDQIPEEEKDNIEHDFEDSSED